MGKITHNQLFVQILYGAICALILLSSCNTIKYLKEDEVLLKKNKLDIAETFIDTKTKILVSQLLPVIKQKPNEKIFGLFRTPLWYHYNTQGVDDTTVFDNWIRKNYAEPPSLIDSSQLSADIRNIQNYLRSKGYRNANVNYLVDQKNKKGIVTYKIDPGRKWIMDTVSIYAVDPILDSILKYHQENSFLKAGQPFDENSFNLEKTRITNLFQNLGFYQFASNYILAQADSSDRRLAVRLIVTNPSENIHKKFYVRNISVFSDIADILPEIDLVQVGNFDGIKFYSTVSKFYIDPKVITRNIFLKSGNVFKKNQLVSTRNRLNRLDIIKLVTIRTEISNDSIDFSFYLPRNKNIVQESSLDINYSTFTTRTQGRSLFGLSGSTNFKNKNLFGRGETLLTNVEAGADLNLSRADSFGLFNSFNLRVQNDLVFPRFIDVFGLFHLLNKIRIGGDGLIKDKFLTSLEDDGVTKLSIIYDYLSLTNFYNRHSLTLGLNYELFPNSNSRYRIGQMGINLWVPTNIKPSFENLLENNLYFKNSFGTRLFTGFIFNSLNFEYRSLSKNLGDYWRFTGSVEVSGHELALVNSIINGKSDTLRLNKSIEFSNFGRLELDIRKYFQVTPNQSLVFRLHSGVAFPYATSSSVPYVKQFFIGGPFSIRAWKVRELGPGSHIDSVAGEPSSANPLFFYQTGDFKLEGNVEYRFPMFWRFQGALFLDAGNIWSLRNEAQDDRANAKLSSNFLKEIAIGSGFGLRTDFQYFILRLDVGTKLRNPYKINGKYYPYNSFSQAMSLRNLNFNIALDYPF